MKKQEKNGQEGGEQEEGHEGLKKEKHRADDDGLR
jgi:hypothetical protein